VRICVLASGSSGNSTLVATERTRLLIDAGLSRREISRRLTKIGESADKLDAILISHEHTDHVSALRVLAAQHSLPVYISQSTRQALPWQAELRWEDFVPGSAFTVGDIEVTPFSIPHDAADPVAFTLRAEGLKVGLVTDLGYVPELVKQHVRGCQVLVLESNHDPELLKVSPYPWHVKQRVLSRNGHLSNLSTAQFLREDYDGEAQVLILGHLSQMNNLPELARMNAEEALQVRNGSRSPRLLVASQTEPTEMIQV
jgi:phosphoribosyl 1,2-cyclic phosphodiesterase